MKPAACYNHALPMGVVIICVKQLIGWVVNSSLTLEQLKSRLLGLRGAQSNFS